MREEDAELGLLALEKGLISQMDLDDCLAAIAGGSTLTLAELFRERGLVDPAGIEDLRAEARRRVLSRQTPAAEASAAPPPPAVVAAEMPPEAAAVKDDPTRRFGRFILVRPVGRGSASEVWRAWDGAANQWVALKILGDSPDVAARLVEGVGPSMGLRHPGIVAVLAAGVPPPFEGERPFIAMEFVDGTTLDREREAGMTIRRAVEIVREAAQAVAYAHENRVIHRDIKPRNIMVDREGRVRVADFGLVRPILPPGPEEGIRVSRSIRARGTPSYMSPEQALNRVQDIGERSDIYSLGAVLYFLVTGRPPFDAGEPLKTCLAVVQDPLAPPSQINAEVPADLDRLISRAMDKDPVRRYESAKAFVEDLDRFLHGAPVLSDDQMLFTRGLAALHAGRLEEAVHMFRELIRLAPVGEGAASGYASLTAQLEAGEQGLTLAIERQQKNYDIRTQRGVYRFARAIIQSLEGGDPSASCKSAMEDFLVAAQLRPEYTPARVNRANVLIFGGRYARDSGKDVSSVFEMALKDLDAAIGFDDTCSHAYHLRGIVNFYIGRGMRKGKGDPEPFYRKAIEDFARAAELEPTYAYIFKDLGVVKVALAKHLLAAGHKVKDIFLDAISNLDTAIRLNKSLYGAYYERGQALFAIKEFKAAVENFRRCMELDPTRDRKVQSLMEEAERRIRERS